MNSPGEDGDPSPPTVWIDERSATGWPATRGVPNFRAAPIEALVTVSRSAWVAKRAPFA